MLPDRYRQLLTAFVDGELSSRQRRHALRLLRRSGEARQLLRQLQGDSEVLRALADRPMTPNLAPDLSASVLGTIAVRRLQPGGRRRLSVRPAGLPAWVGLAAAAAVLLLVGLSSYLYFSSWFAHQAAALPGGSVANNDKKEAPPAPPKPPPPAAPKGAVPEPPPERNPVPPPKPPEPEKPRPPEPGPIVEKPKPMQPDEKPKPGPAEELPRPAPYTDRNMEMFEFKVVDVAPLLILDLKDLDADAGRKKLLGELGKDNAFRLELPCRHGSRAFERLQAVCKSQGLPLVIEQAAQARLKNPQFKTNYVLFVDNVLPDELSRLLQQVGAEDRKGKANEAQFESLVMRRMTANDRKELTDLLGVDALAAAAPAEPGKAVARGAECQVLAMAYNPVRPAKGSPDIKRFLEGRKPPRPGAVQVLLVLRGT
jgi:hypothetical protein